VIRVDCVQGTTAWAQARLGIPTASQFDKIITEKKMEFSKSSAKYMYQLLAEQALGEPLDNATSGLMIRGSVMEHKAVSRYELLREVDTEDVGFILRDDRRAGCSPDKLVGNDGLLELKVPGPTTHIEYLLDDEGIGYKAQTQGQLWICEREWIDTMSFHPTMPGALVRQVRDEKFIAALEAAVFRFHEMMMEAKLKLQKLGMFEGERIPDLRVA
jgi:hypothetical protein